MKAKGTMPVTQRRRTPTSLTLPSMLSLAPYEILHVDSLEWLAQAESNSIHAVVTDPPYGLIEYTPRELEKLEAGRGGVWRIPPAFDGCQRAPLPRFTVLTERDRADMRKLFASLASHLMRVLVPGAHPYRDV